MKKILGISLIVGFFSFMAWAFSYAVQPVWLSSHTATADTTQILCPSRTFVLGTSTITEGGHAILHGVCVNDANSGTISIYNSSSTAVNAVAVIRSTTAATSGCQFFDVQMSSGLVYTTSQPNDVTFLYGCF